MHLKYILREISQNSGVSCSCDVRGSLLNLKIPGPYFLLDYHVSANWHEGFNGIRLPKVIKIQH